MRALERFIRWVCRDTRYHAHYPATVELVHGDDSVDVTPDDDAIRGEGLSSLRPDPGLPATGIRPARGARCLVAFKAGDPKRPFISEWESGGIDRVMLDGGLAGVAGIGDPLEVLLATPCVIAGFIDGVLQPPGAPPPPPIPLAGVPMTGTATLAPGSVTAIITTGNPKVLR